MPSKYRNTPVEIDGVKFASKAEARRWQELRLLERAGEIAGLNRQVPFGLKSDGGERVGTYVADFTYYDPKSLNRLVVEDVKGHVTDLFKWKARHFEAQYGFPITIVRGR